MTKLDACSMADQDEFSRQKQGVMKPLHHVVSLITEEIQLCMGLYDDVR
jgi:hypothetical protein